MEMFQLKQLQSLSLKAKVERSLRKIREWYHHCDGLTCVSFSGGKDSTVLLHLVRSIYPDTPAIFCDTGLEYPEIRDFVKSKENVTWLKPKKTFKKIIEDHGYPIISKDVAGKMRKLQSPTISPRFRDILMNGCSKGKMLMLPKKWRFLLDAPFKISDLCCDVMKKRPANKYAKEKRDGRDS